MHRASQKAIPHTVCMLISRAERPIFLQLYQHLTAKVSKVTAFLKTFLRLENNKTLPIIINFYIARRDIEQCLFFYRKIVFEKHVTFVTRADRAGSQ